MYRSTAGCTKPLIDSPAAMRRRISVALTNLISLVLVMPFFLVRAPVSMLRHALRGTPVAVIALIGGTVGATAPIAGVSPVVSVFIPVLVLLPLAVAVAISPRT